MEQGPFDAAVQALRAAVDALLAADPSMLSGPQLLEAMVGVETQRRRLESLDTVMVAAATSAHLSGEVGQPSAAQLLTDLLKVNPREAKRRCVLAGDLGPRSELIGSPLPPILPLVAEALDTGEISGAHASVIVWGIEKIGMLPIAVHEVVPVIEKMLVDAARHETPDLLRRTVAVVIERLDSDGSEPRDELIQKRRAFTLGKNADGTSTPSGHFTPELTAALEVLLDSLAAPLPAEDGMPDDRSPAQRRHDAMLEVAQRVLRSGSLPAAGGVPVTIVARTTVAELEAKRGLAQTGHGSVFSLPALLSMASECDIVTAAVDAYGRVLTCGRDRRCANTPQRLVLAARDGGCSFPGCTRPAAWTQAHHVREWADGGLTDVDNLTLLCGWHHREFKKRGWIVRMNRGVPEWIPPRWIDREQKPRRNTAQHLPEFDFRLSNRR